MVSDDRESDVYKNRQSAEMMEAMNFGDRVMQKTFGYAYTRADKQTRAQFMINALRRSAGGAKSNAERHYSGDRLISEQKKIEDLAYRQEMAIRRRYDFPISAIEIVRKVSSPEADKSAIEEARRWLSADLKENDLYRALRDEAKENGWNRAIYENDGYTRTAYGRRVAKLRRFINENNIK